MKSRDFLIPTQWKWSVASVFNNHYLNEFKMTSSDNVCLCVLYVLSHCIYKTDSILHITNKRHIIVIFQWNWSSPPRKMPLDFVILWWFSYDFVSACPFTFVYVYMFGLFHKIHSFSESVYTMVWTYIIHVLVLIIRLNVSVKAEYIIERLQ